LGITSFTAPSTAPTTLICSNIFFWPKVLRTRNYQKWYFQQDGASPHKEAQATFLNFRKICKLLISAGGCHIEYK
jgi:hypothetical protein